MVSSSKGYPLLKLIVLDPMEGWMWTVLTRLVLPVPLLELTALLPVSSYMDLKVICFLLFALYFVFNLS